MLAVDAEERVRDPWAPYDVKTPDGVTVEVKSTCAFQSWGQKAPSPPSFGIKPTTWWDPETGKTVEPASRHCGVWVFCVLRTTDEDMPNPMDGSAWDFYVLATEALDQHTPTGKSIALSTLESLGAVKANYGELAGVIGRYGGAATD